jgi:hypothetical protein
MRFNRKTAVATMAVVCSLALAACGEQVVAHVQASDSVHSALTSVFKSPTTQFVVTAQNLPGQASIADGSFSIVVTTSQESGASLSASGLQRAVDVSIYHESTNLVDVREVGESVYLRVDLPDIAAFGSPGTLASISKTLDTLAAHPGLGYLHDILAGSWVGISEKTLVAFAHLIERQLPSTATATLNTQKLSQLQTAVEISFAQSVRMWLSIHQKSADEYSLSLPVRQFAGSLLQGLAKPLTEYLKDPLLSGSELQAVADRIPASLSVRADMWVTNGSMSRLQIFVPNSSASILIDISHPSARVLAPSNATMLTTSNLTALLGAEDPGGLGESGLLPAVAGF